MSSETPARAHTSITYDIILNECVNNRVIYAVDHRDRRGRLDPSHCQRFLPRDKIESLVQYDKVMSTIRESFGENSRDFEDLVKYNMEHAKQVFLTLVFSGTVNHSWDIKNNQFKDENLPVCMNNQHQICNIASNTPFDCFANWKTFEKENFLEKQWIFLAPVFSEDSFEYKFENDQRLPFMLAEEPEAGREAGTEAATGAGREADRGHFGEVNRYKLHPAHYNGRSNSSDNIDGNTDVTFDVALKKLTQNDPQTDVEKFYRRETTTLKEMAELKHNHLIKAIATYTKGSGRYFLFPWANGGNLQQVMKTDWRELDKELINWALHQIFGLSDGIKALHGKNIRHEDIKPSNILCFGPDPGTSNKSTLVIADVGLAKMHGDYTHYRNKFTTTRHGSITYEPLEIFPTMKLSRRYDIWSLGCVFLELIIWVICGINGTKKFHESLNGYNGPIRFWKDHLLRGKIKHPVIKKWIKILKSHLKDSSALRDLVNLIEKKLLVLLDDRADSKTLCNQLEKIKEKAYKIPQYLFNGEIGRLIANRNISIQALSEPVSQDIYDHSIQES